MKFKKGDRVRVKANSKLECGRYAGREGVVDSITLSKKYPYAIKLKDKHFSITFSGNELEKEE